MAASTTKTNPVLRLFLIFFLGVLFVSLVIYSSMRVRFFFGDRMNTEFTVTELSLSHAIDRADDGSFVLKIGSLDNRGARRPCPT